MDLQAGLSRFAIQFVPFLLAVVFNEFGHGFMAARFGDTTARDQGRLTLNPVPHIDPIGTILFPAINMISGIPILIGWAKPVPVDPSRFHPYKSGFFWVHAAGVLANLSLGLIAAFAVAAWIRFVPHDFYLFDPLSKMMFVCIQINFILALFNLIPIPPLDGARLVETFLPREMADKFEAFAPYAYIVLLGLIFTGALGFLSAITYQMTMFALSLAGLVFGVGV
jgi:Zn-dependent protease